MRGLASEFDESTNGVRLELNRLKDAGILESHKEGRTVTYKANKKHILFPEISSIVRKYTGLDQIVEAIVKELGNLELALITGDYAKGIDSGLIDLVMVGDIDRNYMFTLIEKTEALINRKIRPLVVDQVEFGKLRAKFEKDKALLLWQRSLDIHAKPDSYQV